MVMGLLGQSYRFPPERAGWLEIARQTTFCKCYNEGKSAGSWRSFDLIVRKDPASQNPSSKESLVLRVASRACSEPPPDAQSSYIANRCLPMLGANVNDRLNDAIGNRLVDMLLTGNSMQQHQAPPVQLPPAQQPMQLPYQRPWMQAQPVPPQQMPRGLCNQSGLPPNMCTGCTNPWCIARRTSQSRPPQSASPTLHQKLDALLQQQQQPP